MSKENVSPMSSHRLVFSDATPILRVGDFEAAVAYVNELGFELAWRDGLFGCVRRDGATVMLSQGSQGCAGTWVYVSIDDADAYYEEIRDRGAAIARSPLTCHGEPASSTCLIWMGMF